jgi:AraC-like DNA-binding protein
MEPFDKQELLLRIRNLIQMQQELQTQLRRKVIDSGVLLTHAEITSADERFLKKLVTIIEKHLPDSDFRLQVIAREIGMSRAHLNRKLKGVVGQKTNEFIRTLRLKRAAELLAANYGSVAEVAYECGFNHLSYFTRCFKEQYKEPLRFKIQMITLQRVSSRVTIYRLAGKEQCR